MITGGAGQDARLLIESLSNRDIHFICASLNPSLTKTLYKNVSAHITHVPLDITDTVSFCNIIRQFKPTKIFNLAGKSSVAGSFADSSSYMEVNGHAVERVLNELHRANLLYKTRFYQASSSEIFDPFEKHARNEQSKKAPASPYGKSKLYSFEVCREFREKYGYYISSGIMFNHESEYRGEDFLFGKVTRSFAKIKCGLASNFTVGNLSAERDWGYARDYVSAMDKIISSDHADDYVVATGERHSVREMIEIAYGVCDFLSPISEFVIESDDLKRENDYRTLFGNPVKIESELGWTPEHTFKEMVSRIQRAVLLKQSG